MKIKDREALKTIWRFLKTAELDLREGKLIQAYEHVQLAIKHLEKEIT